MKIIDLETYPRRTHFEYFNSLAYPYVGMTANVDVTGLLRFAKAQGGSSFLACLWTAARAANRVPELRQRIVDGKIVELDYCNTAHTVALADQTFTNCYTDSRLPLEEYLADGRRRMEFAATQRGFFSESGKNEQPVLENGADLIYASCVPWVAYTQCIQPVPMPADSNPRIVFGKYIREGDRTLMPLTIQCNHALADGFHIGLFYKYFQEIADSFLEG